MMMNKGLQIVALLMGLSLVTPALHGQCLFSVDTEFAHVRLRQSTESVRIERGDTLCLEDFYVMDRPTDMTSGVYGLRFQGAPAFFMCFGFALIPPAEFDQLPMHQIISHFWAVAEESMYEGPRIGMSIQECNDVRASETTIAFHVEDGQEELVSVTMQYVLESMWNAEEIGGQDSQAYKDFIRSYFMTGRASYSQESCGGVSLSAEGGTLVWTRYAG